MHSRSSSGSPEWAEKETRPQRQRWARGRGWSSAAADGPGDAPPCPACPRRCHRKAWPLPAALRAVTVGREQCRGKKPSLRQGERKDDLFVCRGRHRAFPQGESRGESCAWGPFNTRGDCKSTHTMPPNLPKSFCGEKVEDLGPCGRPGHPPAVPLGPEPAGFCCSG